MTTCVYLEDCDRVANVSYHNNSTSHESTGILPQQNLIKVRSANCFLSDCNQYGHITDSNICRYVYQQQLYNPFFTLSLQSLPVKHDPPDVQRVSENQYYRLENIRYIKQWYRPVAKFSLRFFFIITIIKVV